MALYRIDAQALIAEGLKDSKRMSVGARLSMQKRIDSVQCAVSVAICSAAQIDAQRNRKITLNKIGLEDMLHVAAEVDEKLRNHPNQLTFGELAIDSTDVNPQRMASHFAARFPAATIHAVHHGEDKYPAIAAAAIVAKGLRDACVEEIEAYYSGCYGVSVGSGYPSDPLTQKFLSWHAQHFGSFPPQEMRQTWKRKVTQIPLTSVLE